MSIPNHCHQKLVSAVWQGSKALADDNVSWLAVLQHTHSKGPSKGESSVSSITPENIKAARCEDCTISEVISLKGKG